MPLPKTIVHLLSGGIDSTVMLYDHVRQGHSVHSVLFDYRQRHAQELLFAKFHCGELNVLFTTIELPILARSTLTDGRGSDVVPFRNPILLSLAVNLAVNINADTVTIGCNAEDATRFKDCQWAALVALNHCIKISGYNVEICAPYIQKSKRDIVSLGKELGVQLWRTWSCYAGGSEPCGKCHACIARQEAGA